jgi:hypothetical protein
MQEIGKCSLQPPQNRLDPYKSYEYSTNWIYPLDWSQKDVLYGLMVYQQFYDNRMTKS